MPKIKSKVRTKTRPKERVIETIQTGHVLLKMPSELPKYLADVMHAWKALGNPKASALEASLQLFSKGLKMPELVEGVRSDINLDALRVLHLLGYMDKIVPDSDDWVWRYQLSKNGLQAVGVMEVELYGKPGKGKTHVVDNSKVTIAKNGWPLLGSKIECPECGGTGIDEEDISVCGECEGEGTITVERARQTVPPLADTQRKQLLVNIAPSKSAVKIRVRSRKR